MKSYFAISVIPLFSLLVIGSLSSCPFPPEFWCSSQDIASSCGVAKQCKSWIAKNVRQKTVNLTLLYETLCPDCQEFITGELARVVAELDQEFWQHVTLKVLPYGNARETFEPKQDKWNFRCQHGKTECLGNMVHVCAISLTGDEERKWFPFVHCMELKVEDHGHNPDILKIGQICANQAHLNWSAILTCAVGEEGNLLQHAVAKATPDHQYVPWILINGVHTEEMQEAAEKDLHHLICKFISYPKPFACYKHLKGSSRCYSGSFFKSVLT